MEANPYEPPKERGYLTPDEIDRRNDRNDTAALWITGLVVFSIIMAGQLLYVFFFR